MKSIEHELVRRIIFFIGAFAVQCLSIWLPIDTGNVVAKGVVIIANALAVATYLYCLLWRWFFFRLVKYIFTGIE